MIIEINKTLTESEREDVYEIVNLLVNLDEEVKKKLLYMMLGIELLGATVEEKTMEVVNEQY
ncbi:hypothetical protein K8P03_08425 [Anaerococcus murdochii]|uniref:Uncharacterized protein n=1 Tax=Anaerococcus murdochii TaxID=411577 RepID=A0ABS7T0I9_9FIRM|nr:hypothetical protein [Anaerococcus murdochii]MBZ2387305.1 hypothetical protein [Anaerococcus murdochii]